MGGGRQPQKVSLDWAAVAGHRLPDADLSVAIPGAANGIFFNMGQCCTAGSRLFVRRDSTR